MKGKIIIWVYSFVGIANLISHLIGSDSLELYTKPLLMPILIYYIYAEAKGYITLSRLLLAGALIFSWGGDVALLFKDYQPSFLIGLGSFLIAQIFYIVALNKAANDGPPVSLISLWPLPAYGIVFLSLILPQTGELILPVIIYALVLLGMLGAALIRKNKTTKRSYEWAATGAALFVISDSILALNKFGFTFDLSTFAVMATYISAQYLLVKGVLFHST